MPARGPARVNLRFPEELRSPLDGLVVRGGRGWSEGRGGGRRAPGRVGGVYARI